MRYDWYSDEIIQETKPQQRHQNVVDKYWSIYVRRQILKMLRNKQK